MSKTEIIKSIAYDVASSISDFQEIKGAGIGNQSTNLFMEKVRSKATEKLKADYSERKICGDNSFAVDFYIPEENTIIEIAFSLPNPNSEFEKDILKAIMAKEKCAELKKLVFISRPGGKKKCSQPGRLAFQKWLEEKHQIEVEIFELPGKVRQRRKTKTSAEGKGSIAFT